MKTVKKIWNIVTTVIVAAFVILAVLLVGMRLFGLKPYAVLSGSMEPVYPTGSLIYVKTVDPFTLKAGDVITFMMDEETIATHRIAEVVPEEDDSPVVRFITRGDANEANDGAPVHYKNVIGTPVFDLPLLGYAAEYISHPPGTYAAIAFGALFLLLMFLPELFGSLFSGKGEEKSGSEKEDKTA